MMIAAFVLAAAASTSPAAEAFDICLVHLSNTSAFVASSTEELAQDRNFFEQAITRSCGEEAFGFLLGRPSPDGAKDEFELLEQRWRAASVMRANPPPLPPERRETFRMHALISELSVPGNEERLVDPIECVAAAIDDSPLPISSYINRDGIFLSTQLGPIAAQCRYDLAVDYMTGRVQALSPELDATAARRHADEFMGTMISQARLAPRKGQ